MGMLSWTLLAARNAQVFAVKAQLEAKRIAPLEHGPTAMVEGRSLRRRF